MALSDPMLPSHIRSTVAVTALVLVRNTTWRAKASSSGKYQTWYVAISSAAPSRSGPEVTTVSPSDSVGTPASS